MATAVLGNRVDATLKQEFEETANDLGLSATSALTVFMKRFVAEGGFPFEVRQRVPTKQEYEAEMLRRLADMEAGNYTVHELVEA